MFVPFGHHHVCTFIVDCTGHPFLTLVSVYNRYILCCQFDILGCNASIYLYVLVKVLNLKIDNLLKFVEFWRSLVKVMFFPYLHLFYCRLLWKFVMQMWFITDGLCVRFRLWFGLLSHFLLFRVSCFWMCNCFWLWSSPFSLFSFVFLVVDSLLVVFFLCCGGWPWIGECSVMVSDCVDLNQKDSKSINMELINEKQDNSLHHSITSTHKPSLKTHIFTCKTPK
jgi:hypothetical protein